jgi:hypothetical protein
VNNTENLLVRWGTPVGRKDSGMVSGSNPTPEMD